MAGVRENTLIFYVVGALALGVLAWLLLAEKEVGATRVHYEDLALARLKALAAAEGTVHERTGRYVWQDELERAGLLEDFGVAQDPGHPGVAGAYLTSPRYRLDVLLPHTVTRDDHVAVSLRSAGKRNEQLEAEHFVVVARPWGEALTGYRTFCIDETGRIYVSEGVSDEASRTSRPLPELHLSRNNPLVTGGLRWYPLDDLPHR